MLKLVFRNGNWWYNLDGWEAELYDSFISDRYELVEKKDWKINQLKEKINKCNKEIENYKFRKDLEQTVIEVFENIIKECEEELKELES